MVFALLGLGPTSVWAADSYRWLRVTIDTPWAIFVFLLPMVLIPVVLMAILYWRHALRPSEERGLTRAEREARRASADEPKSGQ